MYPIDRTNLNITEKDTQLLQALDAMWTTKEFFEQAGLPKEQLILWYVYTVFFDEVLTSTKL